MATAHGVSSINLLPKDSFEFSAAGKALKWATTVGRVLVVLTEFVVLLAFASRFYFDKKLDDLGEVLSQKEEQIWAYEEVEYEMRKILTKQLQVETLGKEGLGFSSKIDSLMTVLPIGVVLERLSLGNNGLEVAGNAESEYGFARLISGVKKIPGVAMINMKETSYDQKTGGVKFSIQINFKK